MASTAQENLDQALELLPVEGEIEFDAYKSDLYAVQPDTGKQTFTAIIKGNLAKRRLDMTGDTPKVYLSRKAV